MGALSELPRHTNASAGQMGRAVFGEGVAVVSARFTGGWRVSGGVNGPRARRIPKTSDAVAPRRGAA
ncbi:hypothetical protein GGQ68_000357 [Sagittula marina]|uniref:Uncharacterized protein n=1 Tax=Sagittula marina TaxID=943940 RepID=A0A7W6GQ66_9RHOB|nr:hypothetical protein [Sagittula marina]